jgi:thiamine biosynthesis lipoprotein
MHTSCLRCVAATCVAACAIFCTASCRSSDSGGPAREPIAGRHTANGTALGTTFRLTVYAPDRAAAVAATSAALDRLADVDAALNADRPDSQLSALNASPERQPVRVGDDLFAVLQHAQRLAAVSRGAFDVTTGPYLDTWRRAAAAGRAPSQAELEAARLRCGWENLRLDAIEHTATLTVPGMRIDLSGIAVGYAVDEVMRLFRLHHCDRARVDAGDVVFVGVAPPGAQGWAVSLRDVAPTGGPRTILLDRRAIALAGLSRSRPAAALTTDPASGRAVPAPAPAPAPVAVMAPLAVTAQPVAAAAAALGPGAADTLARAEPSARIRFGPPRAARAPRGGRK